MMARNEHRRMWSRFAAAVVAGLGFAAPLTAQDQPREPSREPPRPASIMLDGSAVPTSIIGSDASRSAVWFASAQRSAVGEVDTASRTVGYMALGHGAKPRGLAQCPNGLLYALDPALNVIHEINPATEDVKRHPLPSGQPADLASAACTASNTLIFTGYNGVVGKLDTALGVVTTIEAAGGRGAFAVTVAHSGQVWFASYVANMIVRIDAETLKQDVVPMPAGVEGPKGIAVDAGGRVWVTAFRSGRVARYDPRRKAWDGWALGRSAKPYAVMADADGAMLVTDTGRDRLLRLDPASGSVRTVASLSDRGQARSLVRVGEQVYVSEMAADRIIVVDTRAPTN
jgi:virginiamycin B lyase